MSSLFCLALICIVPITDVYGEEYLELIDDDRIELDGHLKEWTSTRHSAEYLVKGLIANTQDFDGGLRVAFSRQWIYIGIDGRDDVLLSGRQGDMIELHFANQKNRKHQTFTLRLGELLKQSSLNIKRGRRKVNGAVLRSQFTPQDQGGRYSIEIKIPISVMPWVFGAPVRLSAMFIDHDPERERSLYTTHFANRYGIADEITFTFGGARTFRSLYQQQGSLTLAELSHDWVGDDRDELLVVTSDEIILFGRQVKRGSGYTRVIHGLPLSASSLIKVEGEKPRRRVVISYQKSSDESELAGAKIAYRLKRGRLIRIRKP
jgi:hypothetical protein